MWRGVSLRKLALLIFGPMLTESLSTLFMAWMIMQAVRDFGYAPRHQMLIAAMGSVGYAISAFLAGRWVRPKHAPALMIGSILGVCLVGLGAMWLRTFGVFLGAAFCLGLLFGHYYTPFQIRMTHVRPFRTLAWSVAFYNLAWGTGAAVGPLLGSSLRAAPMTTLILLAASLTVVHTILQLLAAFAPPPHPEHEPEAAFASTSLQRKTSLAAFLVVGLVIRGLYATLWPDLGARHGWSDLQIGLGQMAMFLPVGIVAALLARLRRRLTSPWIMVGSMLVGAAGFVMLPRMAQFGPAVFCAGLAGMMEACVVYHAIYYMNSDPDPIRRAKNVGIFEMTAGLGFLLGPIVLGLLAWDDATGPRPWIAGAFLLACVTAWVVHCHIRNRPVHPAADAG